MVGFEVGPEQAGQDAEERVEAVVVQGRLALLQVIRQQVTDRAAGEVVAVDHLLGRELAGRAQMTERRRRLVAEDPDLAQRLIEQRGAIADPAVGGGLGVEQFRDVPDGDLGDGAAPGGHDQRAAVQHPGGGAL